MNCKQLSEFVELYDSLHKTPESYSEAGFPMVRAGDLKEGFLNLSTTLKVSKEVYREFTKRYIPKKGDVILSRVGHYNGVPSYVNTTDVFCLGQNTVIIHPVKIDSKYLYYCLKSPMVQKQILQFSTGSTHKTISLKSINEISIPCITHSRQKQIGEFLFTIDLKIKLNAKIIKKIEEIVSMLFRRWFIDFEFPNEKGLPYRSSGGEMVESELGEVPKGWDVYAFKNIMTISSGKRPKNKVEQPDLENTVPIIGASKIMGYTTETLYEEPILVIGRVGTHGVVQRLNRKCWASDNTLVIKSDYYNFTYQVLNRIDYNSLNRGSTQPLITQTDIKEYLVVKPDEIVLNLFENISGKLLNRIILLQDEITNLQELRDTLLPKLLSGEIEIPDESVVEPS
ncbi:restriction endonuclease subunit S [Lysinibacillus fusiformis]|uniref:restriction endonuclease subunit S n=1 Tax=Lysinibacillus fusiformis TaxID=28031 RepID=UPI003D034AFF